MNNNNKTKSNELLKNSSPLGEGQLQQTSVHFSIASLVLINTVTIDAKADDFALFDNHVSFRPYLYYLNPSSR